MIKKFLALISVSVILLSFCSCNIDNDKSQVTHSYSFTQKSTLIHNHFKEKLPEYNFKNEPVEKYRDGISYTMSVTCKQKDFGKYVNKLKKAGFEQNQVEAQTYFSADTKDGYFVEVTYVGDMLTVFVKKI